MKKKTSLSAKLDRSVYGCDSWKCFDLCTSDTQ